MPPKPFDFSPSLGPDFIPSVFGNSLRLDRYSYKVDSVSNKPEASTSSSTLWCFILSVLSSLGNARELARELGTKYSEDFRDININTSRYMTIGSPGGRPISFSEMKFKVNVYTSNADWIRMDAPPTTTEGLLGFPVTGENLSFEEIVALLVKQNAPEKKPYRPTIVRPGTEIGYVNVPFNKDGVNYSKGAVWELGGSVNDAATQELVARGVLKIIDKGPVTNYNKPKPEPEKRPKQQPPKNRVIRQRSKEDSETPSVLRRVIKKR